MRFSIPCLVLSALKRISYKRLWHQVHPRDNLKQNPRLTLPDLANKRRIVLHLKAQCCKILYSLLTKLVLRNNPNVINSEIKNLLTLAFKKAPPSHSGKF